MNKQELTSELKKSVGGAAFITRKQLAEFMGLKDPKSVDPYLHGLPSSSQRYFIADVAGAICDQQKWK